MIRIRLIRAETSSRPPRVSNRLFEQVKRTRGRFPDDFMFQLTVDEWRILK